MVLADVLNRSMSRTQPVHRDDIDQQLEYTDDALAVDTIHQPHTAILAIATLQLQQEGASITGS